MSDSTPSERRESMAGLAKGLAIIEAFSTNAMLTVTDAARAAGASRAAARRCLLTLVELNYLELVGREFRPLPRLRRLGAVASAREKLIHIATPLLERARDELAESVSLAVLDNDQSHFIARAEAEHIVSTGVKVGANLPLYCSATGRVLLGGHADDDIERRLLHSPMIARTPKGLATVPDVLKAVREAEQCGYAISDEELALGIRSLAVPVTQAGGQIVAAVSVSAASARAKVGDLKRSLLPVVLTCAEQISKSLDSAR